MSDDDWFERALGEATDDDPTEHTEPPAEGADTPAGNADPDDGEAGLFEEDFAAAFAGAGDPEEFGGDADAAPDLGAEEFADEDLDSDIPRTDIGVDGLDSMIQGGVPERSMMVTIGSAGTGKSTLGMQFLRRGLEHGERCVFIALEEGHDAVVAAADEKGWDFSGHEEEGRLAVIDLDPIEMANSIESIRSELPHLVERFGASRLVLDSVSLLEMMYDDAAERRTEIYDFTHGLENAGVTTMLTSEASQESAYNSRFGIIEYLTDAVFVLQYIRNDDYRETRLAVEIQKIRNANHSRETKPYELTAEGIEVYRQANIF